MKQVYDFVSVRKIKKSSWLIENNNIGILGKGACYHGALAFTIFLWLFTTDQATLVRSLVAIGLPYPWGLTLAIALRYLPTMASAGRRRLNRSSASISFGPITCPLRMMIWLASYLRSTGLTFSRAARRAASVAAES